jgi:hypothetical protein
MSKSGLSAAANASAVSTRCHSTVTAPPQFAQDQFGIIRRIFNSNTTDGRVPW